MARPPARRDAPEVLPASTSHDFSREVAAAAREHQLVAAMRLSVDRADTETLGEALRVALDAEVILFKHGLMKANGSPVIADLVASKVDTFRSINLARITRRWS